MARVIVDGRAFDAPEGTPLVEALRALGVPLPTLCHDDRLEPTGACRLCLVHVAGQDRPVTACTTLVHDGLIVDTETPELLETRRTLLGLLAADYPQAVVAQYPEKPFHQALFNARVTPGATGPVRGGLEDRSHPYIAVDMARCISCYRCVRICDDLQGQGVWHVRDRGAGTVIVPDGPSLLDSSCVGCGACVDTCPTGALEDVSVQTSPPPSSWTRTTCPYCGVGCEMTIGTSAGRIVAVKPVLEAPVSKGHLCVKGRYAFDFVSAPDRVLTPLIRDGKAWRPTSWDEAESVVVEKLHALMDRYGPDSIGVLGSARATNEENYLAQKLARIVIGTNNVDSCARVCHTPSGMALKRVLGAGLGTNSFDDIEIARAILVWGANPTESHPVVGARIRQAARRGAGLIVVDSRRTELAECATIHLAPRPGTDIALMNGMAHVIVAEHLGDERFMDERVADREAFERFVGQWSPERAEAVCGVAAGTLRQAARLYATSAPAMCLHGLGLTEHVQGTEGVMALINLALLTGNLGKPGAGVNPLRGQNNVQGAAHMGCDPAALPGSVPFEQGRADVERQWGAPLPTTRGLHQLAMMDAAVAGQLKALWAIGYDVLATNANRRETTRALGALEFVIVQDLFLTETAREYGSVFLPACSSFEKDGTFMNAERRIQRVRAALSPAGMSKPDWQILCEIGRKMGGPGFDFDGPLAIWNEVRTLCPGARGMSYERLDGGGLQWPCPSEDHPGTAILHRGEFAIGPRAALRSIEYRSSPETVTTEYPWTLITGRSLYQFNTGTMTGRTKNTVLRPTDYLEISPSDADELGVADGAPVRIVSRYGEALLPLRVTAALVPGRLFATFHASDVSVNDVTGPYRDAIAGTPEYKITAVRLEPVSGDIPRVREIFHRNAPI